MGFIRHLSGTEQSLEKQLRGMLGDDSYFALIEAFGGTRLHIPKHPERTNRLSTVLNAEAIGALSGEWAGLYLNVPISREFRAVRFRAEGLSNGKIATRLCMTEKGVERIFLRRKKLRTVLTNDNRRQAANDAGFPAPKRRLIKAAGDE